MLGRNGDWLPALRWTILAVTALAAVAMLLAWSPPPERLAMVATAVGLVAALAGPAAYALATIGRRIAAAAHSRSGRWATARAARCSARSPTIPNSTPC